MGKSAVEGHRRPLDWEGSSPVSLPRLAEVPARLLGPLAHSCAPPPHRVPFRMARRGVVRKSREWVLEKKERRRRQGK